MGNELRTPADRIEKDNGQSDETMIRKKELANANTTIDNNMSNDSCTPALTVRIDRKQTDKVHVDVLPGDDIMVSNPQTCRKISGNLEINTSDVIDDPRKGAKVNDSERKETKPGPSDTSPTKGVTNDNISNDTRKHSYAIRKDGRQTNVPENRKGESDDKLISNDTSWG